MAKTSKPAPAGDTKKAKSEQFYTPPFVLSFPDALYVPKTGDFKNAKPKFSVQAIWTPANFTDADKVAWKKLLSELNRVSLAKYGKPWKELPANIKKGLRNGNEKPDLVGYGDGTRFATLSTQVRPGVVLHKKDPKTGKWAKVGPEFGNEHLIYPGCICRALVNVYPFGGTQDNPNKGLSLGLFALQKLKDGPRIDNAVSAEDAFDSAVDEAWLDQADDDFDGEGDGDDFGDDAEDGEDDDFS